MKNSRDNKKVTGIESIIIKIASVICFLFMIAIAILGVLSVFEIVDPYTPGMVTVFGGIFIVIIELILLVIHICNRIRLK